MGTRLFIGFLHLYFAFSVALCFYFYQYDFFVDGILVSEVMLISSSIPCLLFSRGIRIKFSGPILFYYFISLLLFFLSISISNSNFPLVPFWKVVSRLIRYGAYAILILIVSDNSPFRNKETNLMLKIYKIFCYLFAIYAIIQALVYMVSHYMLPANILPISWSRDVDTEVMLLQAQSYYFRGFGPFQEPSYLSKFLLPGFAFSLMGWTNNMKIKTDWKLAIIILGAIFLSTSVQGMLISGITICMYFFDYKKSHSISKLLMISLILIVSCVFLFSNIPSVALDRIHALFNGQDYGYSTGMRLFRGFAFWYKMPFVFKIFGTGLGNMGNFAIVYDIFTNFDYAFRDANFLEYGSGISLVLVQTGIIGLSIISYWFYRSFKYLNFTGKIILVQFILVLLSGATLFSALSVFYCSLIFINRKEINNL